MMDLANYALATLRSPKQRDPATYARGEHSGNARHTRDDVLALRTEYWVHGTHPEVLMGRYGYTKGAVYNLIKRRTWAHLPKVEGEP